jgi:hypothetical protein
LTIRPRGELTVDGEWKVCYNVKKKKLWLKYGG